MMLAVSSLGEVVLDKEIVAGTVKYDDLDIPSHVLKRHSRADREYISKLVAEEVEKQIDRAFDPMRALEIKAVHDKQIVNDGRFRVWAGVKDRELRTYLVTEFRFFTDEKKTEKVIAEAVGRFAVISVMFEGPNTDRTKNVDDDHWIDGPDYGRPERQIEVRWDVTALTIRQIRALIDQIRESTQHVWDLYGVSVI